MMSDGKPGCSKNNLDISVEDKYSCPICFQLLCKPIKLPCRCATARYLCLACFQTHIATQARSCPFCRTLLIHWSKGCETCIDEKLWAEIQRLYPQDAAKRVQGLDSSFCLNVHRQASSPQLAETGEIRFWYEQELAKLREEKAIEEKQSEEYIQKLFEEEKARNELIQKVDDALAVKIQGLDNSVDIAAVLKQGKEQIEGNLSAGTDVTQDKPVRPEDLVGYEPEDKPKEGEPDKILYPKSDVALSRRLAGDLEPEDRPEPNETSDEQVVASVSLDEMSLQLSQQSSTSDHQPITTEQESATLEPEQEFSPIVQESPASASPLRNEALHNITDSQPVKVDFFDDGPNESAAVVQNNNDEAYSDFDLLNNTIMDDYSMELGTNGFSDECAASPNSIDEPNPTRFRPLQPEPTSPPKRNHSGRALPNNIVQVEPIRPVKDNHVLVSEEPFRPLPELHDLLNGACSSMFKKPMPPPSHSKVYKQLHHKKPTSPSKKNVSHDSEEPDLGKHTDAQTPVTEEKACDICVVLNNSKVDSAAMAVLTDANTEPPTSNTKEGELFVSHSEKSNANEKKTDKCTAKKRGRRPKTSLWSPKKCKLRGNVRLPVTCEEKVTESAPAELLTTASPELLSNPPVYEHVTVRKKKKGAVQRVLETKEKTPTKKKTSKHVKTGESNKRAAKHRDSPIVQSVDRKVQKWKGRKPIRKVPVFNAAGDTGDILSHEPEVPVCKPKSEVKEKRKSGSKSVSSSMAHFSKKSDASDKLNQTISDEPRLRSHKKAELQEPSCSVQKDAKKLEAIKGKSDTSEKKPKATKRISDTPVKQPKAKKGKGNKKKTKVASKNANNSNKLSATELRDEKFAKSLQKFYDRYDNVECGKYTLRGKV